MGADQSRYEKWSGCRAAIPDGDFRKQFIQNGR